MPNELRLSNMAEAFVKAAGDPKARYATVKRLVRVAKRPDAGLVENSTGRKPRRKAPTHHELAHP